MTGSPGLLSDYSIAKYQEEVNVDYNERENKEALAFDKGILNEFRNKSDTDLILSAEILKNHVGLTQPPKIAYRYAIFLLRDSEIEEKCVLNVACGSGYESIILAKKGAKVFAFDISSESVAIAIRRAQLNGVSERLVSEVMSVYNLKYSDGKFNYVFGSACLHHFDDIEKALKEISRVLKTGGRAVFFEPYGGSKILQKIRKMIPVRESKISDDEKQLTYENVQSIKSIFKKVTVEEYGLFNRLDRIIKSAAVMNFLSEIDFFILKRLPFLKKFARSIVITIEKYN